MKVLCKSNGDVKGKEGRKMRGNSPTVRCCLFSFYAFVGPGLNRQSYIMSDEPGKYISAEKMGGRRGRDPGVSKCPAIFASVKISRGWKWVPGYKQVTLLHSPPHEHSSRSDGSLGPRGPDPSSRDFPFPAPTGRFSAL